MKRLVLLSTLPMALALGAPAAAATALSDPEAVVRAYADAATRHDLEGLLALYAPDIRKYRFPGEFASQGVDHNREVYIRNFAANPNLKVQILQTITVGDKVVSRDRVTDLAGGKTSEEITIYQVREGHITDIEYVAHDVH